MNKNPLLNRNRIINGIIPVAKEIEVSPSRKAIELMVSILSSHAYCNTPRGHLFEYDSEEGREKFSITSVLLNYVTQLRHQGMVHLDSLNRITISLEHEHCVELYNELMKEAMWSREPVGTKEFQAFGLQIKFE